MKKQRGWLLGSVFIVLVAAVLAWWLTRGGEGEGTPHATSTPPPASEAAPEVAPAPAPVVPPPAPAPMASEPPRAAPSQPVSPPVPKYQMPEESPAQQEAASVALNIRSFGQRFGGNPTGTNAEIVKALTGGNQAGATYLPAELRKLNSAGELLDFWGTPYFFHSDSATSTEVRSAGPDKVMYTQDDVVSK